MKFLICLLIISISFQSWAIQLCDRLYYEAQTALEETNQSLGAFDFEKLTPLHYEAYFNKELESAFQEVDRLIADDSIPTFKNTILALEKIGEKTDLALYPAYQINSTTDSPILGELLTRMLAKGNELSSKIGFSQKIYERVRAVRESAEYKKLDAIDKQLVDDTLASFERSGVSLPTKVQSRIKEIQNRGLELSTKFKSNIIDSKQAKYLHFNDAKELEGLTTDMLAMCENNAAKRNLKGYVIEAKSPASSQYLKYLKDSEMRKKVYHLVNDHAKSGEFNNEEVILELLQLRHEYANILGFEDYASFAASKNMAKTKENILENINSIIERTETVNEVENQRFKDFVASKSVDPKSLKPWDKSYYYKKYKDEVMNFDENEIKPYFELEHTMEGILSLVEKLYSIKFQKTNIPAYHKDIDVYLVVDQITKEESGLFYFDLYARDGKRAGAWMTSLRNQYQTTKTDIRPHIINSLNVAKPEGKKTLLMLSEVNTILHELGHGLHGLLSKVKYASMSGTSVVRDFVEFPSTFMEYFLRQPWFLKTIGKHYETGEALSDELIDQIIRSITFDYSGGELSIARLSLMDIRLHTQEHQNVKSLKEFEDQIFKREGESKELNGVHRIYTLSHLFSGFHAGYSAQLYVYRWAEVFAANAFKIFEGEKFSPAVARRFREYILSRGGFGDATENYLKFSNGIEPDPEAFFEINGIN